MSPKQILVAQLSGMDRALRRAFAPIDTALVDELLRLLQSAAEAASTQPEGRPLFAAYTSLDRPDEPHLALWHAHYLLREFRGDGHIAVLVAEGLTGVEAFAIHVAQARLGDVIRRSRAWTDDEWASTIDSLRSRGWLLTGEDLALSEVGTRRREAIERRTNELNWPAYAALGQDGCERIIELAAVVKGTLATAGLTLDASRLDALTKDGATDHSTSESTSDSPSIDQSTNDV